MKLVLTAFFMAWGMFWIVPCPVKWWDEKARIGMLLFLPLFGAFIGGAWALAVWVLLRYSHAEYPGTFSSAILTIIPFVLSGFIHLDGYMDCADAVLSRRDLETRRKILKDSHVGSFAVIALVSLFLLQYGAIYGQRIFYQNVLLLPLVCAAPRAYATAAVLHFPTLPGSSYKKMFSDGVPARAKTASIVILTALLVLPPLIFPRGGLCTVAGVLGAMITIMYLRHDLGGMSGDISGAGITVGELCALAYLVFVR